MEHKRQRPARYSDPEARVPEEQEYGRRSSETPSLRRRRETEPPRERQRRRPEADTVRASRNAGASSESRRRNRRAEQATQKTPTGERKRSAGADRTRKTAERPKVRSERSINAEKQRKAIRKENARLERLREKQRRKAKRRTVKRINKGLFKRLIIMAGVIVAVILSMVIFFRVETIEIRGAAYYSREEILKACGVATGDNLLTLSRGEISGNIMAPLKYVESVKVSRQLPNTLIIQVTESDPQYAVQDVEGNFYLMTAEGRVVESITGSGYKDFTIVEGLTIEVPTLGEDAVIHADQSESTKAKGQLEAMKSLLSAIERASLGRHIASVQIPSAYKLTLWYEDRFLVELGDTKRIDYKLEYLKTVIDEQEPYVTGTIDLTLSDGDKANLRPDK